MLRTGAILLRFVRAAGFCAQDRVVGLGELEPGPPVLAPVPGLPKMLVPAAPVPIG